jgi:hypothetical protein
MKLNILAGDISPLVFHLSVKNEPGELNLDRQMLAVIGELDGRKSVGTITKNLGIDLDRMKEILAKLLTLKLIVPVSESMPIMKEDFFVYLTDELSRATGPMAEVLIDEAVSSLGYNLSNFPKHRAQELMDLLASKIFREEKKVAFKQNIYKKLLG